MPQNPLRTLFDPARAAESAQILRSGPGLASERMRTVDALFGSKRPGGQFDPDPLQRFHGTEEEILADDPVSQRYGDVAEAQTDEVLYNLPGAHQQREDALMRTLTPIREKGAYDLEQERIRAKGQVSAAEAAAGRTAATQAGTQRRAEMAEQGRMRRQQNQALQTRGMAALKQDDPRWWWERLMGKPGPKEEAETHFAQMQFGEEGGDDNVAIAREFVQQYGNASDEEILQALQQQFDADDPNEYLQVLQTIRELQGR